MLSVNGTGTQDQAFTTDEGTECYSPSNQGVQTFASDCRYDGYGGYGGYDGYDGHDGHVHIIPPARQVISEEFSVKGSDAEIIIFFQA